MSISTAFRHKMKEIQPTLKVDMDSRGGVKYSHTSMLEEA